MGSSTSVKIVMRLNDSWSLVEVNGNLVPLLHDPLWVCPRHAEPLVLHEFRAYKDSRGFMHIDARVKCPRCDWFTVFGIAMPNDEALLRKIQQSKYHGKVLRAELMELLPAIKQLQKLSDDTAKYIEERLKRWGYW